MRAAAVGNGLRKRQGQVAEVTDHAPTLHIPPRNLNIYRIQIGYRSREESGGADGAGSGVLRTRWLPRLSAAIERGAWRRLRVLLRAVSGVADGDVLPASELTCLPELLRGSGGADCGVAGA